MTASTFVRVSVVLAVTAVLVLFEGARPHVAAEARGQAPRTTPEIPTVEGEFWRIARNPDIGKYSNEKAQPVDFSIWQATDGTWQLVSCVRYTNFPGGTRLLYRWESPSLTAPDWEEKGLFLTSDASPDYAEGVMQAPHVIRDGERYLMYFNTGGGAYVLESRDGKNFTPVPALDGGMRHFPMNRDVMIFDNRERDGKVYAYYTAVTPPAYPTRRNHTVGARVAPSLMGPWGELIDVGVNTPDTTDPEYRNGFYYRWEQMNVYASRDPLKWPAPEITTMAGSDPREYYAPEIIEHDGQFYIAGYRYGAGRAGIYMARFTWR
jgi:hypothetical protein